MNNGFLYSEQNIANKDEIDWQEGKSSEVTNNSILGHGFDSILNIDNIIEESVDHRVCLLAFLAECVLINGFER